MSYKKIIALCYHAVISARGYGGLDMKGPISDAQGDGDKDQLNTTINDKREFNYCCELITGHILLCDTTTKSSGQDKQNDVSLLFYT
jgi:hypothetical protein